MKNFLHRVRTCQQTKMSYIFVTQTEKTSRLIQQYKNDTKIENIQVTKVAINKSGKEYNGKNIKLRHIYYSYKLINFKKFK